MTDADPSAILAGIRARHLYIDGPAYVEDIRASADDVPLLLAAVGAALELPGGWEQETARLDALAQSTADPQSRVATSMRAQAFEECARKLRAAITAALTGEEAGSDEH